jgi:hypothetical protein
MANASPWGSHVSSGILEFGEILYPRAIVSAFRQVWKIFIPAVVVAVGMWE